MTVSRLISAIFAPLIAVSAGFAISSELIHVRLKDRLDRPQDGYCFDILGTGSNLRLELPLFAHNCKGGATPDSSVVYTSKGHLVFPAAAVCVTAFGVNNTVLPGVPVLLRPCGYQKPFFEASRLQEFDYLENGQLKLRGHGLCVTVGDESSHTYSPHDRWRVLLLDACSDTPLTHSAWELVPL